MTGTGATDPAEERPCFVAAVVVVILRGDRILAMRRSPMKDAAPGAWEAISGRIRPGEQPLEAAIREAREETGLTPRIDPDPIAAYQAKRKAYDMIVVAFRACSDSGDVTRSEEHDAHAWMTLEEFADACPFPLLVGATRRALTERG